MSASTPDGYEPFTWRATKSGEIHVFRGGVAVTTLRGAAAVRALSKLGVDDATDQRVLQRLTGNYRRGNER